MITAVSAPEPSEEPDQEPKTEAEIIADYKVDRKATLESVANVVTAAANKAAESASVEVAPLDFDEAFANFRKDTELISATHANRENLKRLGIDPEADDTVFGARHIYCGAHRRVHGAGWCTVRLSQKRPLKAEDRVGATNEAADLGLLSEDDK